MIESTIMMREAVGRKNSLVASMNNQDTYGLVNVVEKIEAWSSIKYYISDDS